MSPLLQQDSAVLRAVAEHCKERIAMHTKTCISLAVDERQRRDAAAAIDELSRIVSLYERARTSGAPQ